MEACDFIIRRQRAGREKVTHVTAYYSRLSPLGPGSHNGARVRGVPARGP